MRQRSVRHTTEPGTQMPMRRSQSYKPNPPSYGRRNMVRNFAKRIYKKQKSKEREIGREIDNLMQELHYERRVVRERPPETEDQIRASAEFIKNTVTEIRDLRQVGRIKTELPSFAAFYRYIRKEGITLEELKELEKELKG